MAPTFTGGRNAAGPVQSPGLTLPASAGRSPRCSWAQYSSRTISTWAWVSWIWGTPPARLTLPAPAFHAATTKSTAYMDQTSLEQLTQLEKLFPPGEQGLGYAASQFLNAMVDVTSRPSDPSARQVALGRANEMAVRFSNAGQQINDLQAGVVSDLKANVSVVKVNPKAEVIFYGSVQLPRKGDERTACRFILGSNGEVLSVNTLPKTIVERTQK